MRLVYDLNCVAAEVPAGGIVELREERAGARLRLRLVVEDADFAAVERGGVENGDGREDGVGAVAGYANAKHDVVAGVKNQEEGNKRQQNEREKVATK